MSDASDDISPDRESTESPAAGAVPGGAHRPDLDLFGRPAPRGGDWSHRRGEPRIFAFFWTLYLLLATIGAFWSVGAPRTHDPAALRPAARAVLAAITVGIALLWPMTRLSQERPAMRLRRISRSVWQDLLVLLVPAQAIIWPQIAMAAWPVAVVGALAASMAAWGLLLGGLLAVALTADRVGRGWWMLLFVALAGLGPLVALGPAGGSAHAPEFDWWWMTSPVTSGFEIARDRPWTGSAAAATASHWRAIALVAASGAGLWAILWLIGLFHGRRSA